MIDEPKLSKANAMDGTVVSTLFNWNGQGSGKMQLVNKLLKMLKSQMQLKHPCQYGEMTTREMRMNIFHLLSSNLVFNVDGDVCDLGCFNGQTTVLLNKIIAHYRPEVQLHAYDKFHASLGEKDPKEAFYHSFKQYNIPLPHLHEGDFYETIPKHLPDKICFANIDCGFGGNPNDHKNVILHLLQHVYPRMTTHAVCVFVDYADANNPSIWNINKGVKPACDTFFSNKPEKVESLFGGDFFQGYFRKL